MAEELSWPVFEEWVAQAPMEMRSLPLWKSLVYRKAMYFYDLAWSDCERLQADFRGKAVATQLIRSVGSVVANLEEAFGRGIQSADARRILRIALGEARESQGWYLRGRHLFPEEVWHHRVALAEEIVRLLLTAIRTSKG